MITAVKVQNRIYYGYDKAAVRLGYEYTIYRSPSAIDPISPANNIGTIFVSPNVNWAYDKYNKYGNSLWQLVLDGRRTRPGDYLITTQGYSEKVFFIGAQELILPILGVECNRRIKITRPARTSNTNYGGYDPAEEIILARDLPASFLISTHSGETNKTNLPLDTKWPRYQAIIPRLGNLDLRIGDLVDDDLNKRSAITGIELTDYGYRLNLYSQEL